MLVRIINTKSSKWLLHAVHWILPILSLYFIFVLVDLKTQNQTFTNLLIHFFDSSTLYFTLSLFFALTIANISIESMKWKFALAPYLKISNQLAFSQTLMAMSAGFITPFRSGALLSRFFTNNRIEKKSIINASLKMGFAQASVTILFSVVGSVLFFIYSENNFFAISILVLFFFLLFFLHRFFNNRTKLISWKKYDLAIEWDKPIFYYSILRYLVFSCQYFFILKTFGVHASPILLFSLITFTFLVNTVIPSGILGKIGIRELSGILIIGETTGFVLETSCAAFLIWILNQAVPAITGSVIHLRKLT